MEILFALIIALAVLALPFVLPIATWVSMRHLRQRLSALETTVSVQRREIERLLAEVHLRRPTEGAPAKAETREAAAPAPESLRTAPAATAPPPATKIGERAPEPVREPRVPAIPPVRSKPEGRDEPGVMAPRSDPADRPAGGAAPPQPAPRIDEPHATGERGAAATGVPPSQPPPRPPAPRPSPPARPPFDWESLIGVKLFSAIAGIALVIAAVFFLRYSIDSGWLQPPVRVAIGVIVAAALLVACELKAARRYRVTANALDAAAIAMLFSTFFAAHALWHLIPGAVAFGLLGLVTALAVLLSIRRESLFIAVLGLLGGFATPALLSTGENRPIPLFAYLLLLNVGLAWVAYAKRWPVLAWLTLAFTTLYQWGWVIRYLDASSLPLAMGIFILFPIVSVAALMLSRTSRDAGAARAFNGAALLASVLPVLFGLYLAAVPAYGAHAALLFGFVLTIDIGLLAIAIARREELLHAVGALATLLALGIWLATSYSPDSRLVVLGFAAAFSLLFAFAPAVAIRFGRRFEGPAAATPLAGSFVLFVFAAVPGIDRTMDGPWAMFLLLLALVMAIAARAIAVRDGRLYFVAAFFAVAAQAVWSARYLTVDRLGSAVAIYALFGLLTLAVPLVARRARRPLRPAWGGGAVLLGSLLLLLFLSRGPVALEALWALGLLLAILNAAVFVETAGAGLPMLSQAGSVLSWIVLAAWWSRAAGSVGVIPSLTVVTGLTLVTLAGHAWASMNARRAGASSAALRFSSGLYLALIGHFFLLILAANRVWALPPWPLAGALAVMTLATSAAALVTRSMTLHTAGAIASAIVIAVWTGAVGAPPYGTLGTGASILASAYAVAWIRFARKEDQPRAGVAAVGTVLAGEGTALAAAASGTPPFELMLAVHAANAACLLWLSTRFEWRMLPIVATGPAWLAMLRAGSQPGLEASWVQLLVLSGALYAVFAAYPLVLGRRASGWREPYLAALIASAMFFVGARRAFTAGGLAWMIGVVPLTAGAVLVLLLRQLLAIQRQGERDTGRLALVAGGALAFATVAIPLQLEHQWITIGWAIEGAALAWLSRRIPHQGLLVGTAGLFALVFVRLALNPEILLYEPRGTLRILNWYLYTYVTCALSMFVAARWLATTGDRLGALPRLSSILPAAGVILLFLLLNIEIADYYATGPAVTFRFGVTVSQDLTYTIGWLAFGMALLAAGIYLSARPARIAAVALIAVTTFKCFLYDLGSLGGLYRVGSFVGLALSLALVALALQKFVLSKPREMA